MRAPRKTPFSSCKLIEILSLYKSPIELICDVYRSGRRKDKANFGDVLCYRRRGSEGKNNRRTNPTIKNKSENNLLVDGVGRRRHAGMCNDLTNSPTTIVRFMTRHANASQPSLPPSPNDYLLFLLLLFPPSADGSLIEKNA